MGTLFAILCLSAFAAPCAFGRTAATTEVGLTRADPAPSPLGLPVRGSNGDEVVVQSVAPRDGNGSRVWITASGKHGSVKYSAPANLSREGIRSNLGKYGRIDLRWVPNGRIREVRVKCQAGIAKKFFAAGAYVGTFRFRGGGGFTSVRLHRIAWRRNWYGVGNSCPFGVSEGFPGPGVILEAGRRGNVFSPIHLFVVKPEAGARVSYNLRDFRIEDGIKVTRSAFVSGGTKTLTVTPNWMTGQITPPAPFFGTGTFERTEDAKGTWTGNLGVEFPDNTKLRLTGDAFEAILHSGYYQLHQL
ncbi:MAG: hypothetical protein QM729_09555 [Solirubrobacterales bacterium]